MFNRSMLPSYYGILYLACKSSRTFTRQIAGHQNIHWAFKNITPYPLQYPQAVDELLKIMALMIKVSPDAGDDERRLVRKFKRDTIALYLQNLDARSHWQTLIAYVEAPSFSMIIKWYHCQIIKNICMYYNK